MVNEKKLHAAYVAMSKAYAMLAEAYADSDADDDDDTEDAAPVAAKKTVKATPKESDDKESSPKKSDKSESGKSSAAPKGVDKDAFAKLQKLDLETATRPEMVPLAKALGVDVAAKTTVEVQAALKKFKAEGGSSQLDDEDEETPEPKAKGKVKPKADEDDDADDDTSDASGEIEYPEVKVMKRQIKQWAAYPEHQKEIKELIGPEFYDDENDDTKNPQERLHLILGDVDELKEAWKDNVYPMIEDGTWKKVEKHAAKSA